MSNDMNHHIKVYRNVFIGLLIFTGLTVLASYYDFGGILWLSIGVGLAIAFFKGYLVAANFMHLNSEKKMIYWILLLTVFFLVLLLFIPLLWDINNMSNY